jgi:Spy/CpxP family protein refolding chaperone
MRNVILVLAAALILMPVVTQAQQCPIMGMADELKLTDQQIEQLQANAMANHKEMIQTKADLEKAKLELREIMMAKQIDKKAALKKQEAISAIKATMAQKRLANRIDRMNLLTDDQRAAMRKTMMRSGHKGRGMGFGPGDGPCDMRRGMGRYDKMGMGKYRQFQDIDNERNETEGDDD